MADLAGHGDSVAHYRRNLHGYLEGKEVPLPGIGMAVVHGNTCAGYRSCTGRLSN